MGYFDYFKININFKRQMEKKKNKFGLFLEGRDEQVFRRKR